MQHLKLRAFDRVLNKMFYSEPEQHDDALLFRFEHFEDDEPVYMRWTGKVEPYDNNRMIYEGDIVSISYQLFEEYTQPDKLYIVTWERCKGRYVLVSIKDRSILEFDEEATYHFKGNKYENRELLEEVTNEKQD